MSINDQIADLGTQLETAILDTYTAVASGGLASLAGQPLLAFLPGDIAVPVASFVEPVTNDSLVGSSATSSAAGTSPKGQSASPAEAVNPMLVTSWLKSDGVGADTPLLVQTNQTTVIGGPPGGFTTMSELYFDLVAFAQPLAAAGSPDADRLGQLLIWAREALPSSPDVLPLVTQPGDWPLPDTTYWNKFSFTYTPTTPPPTAGGQDTQTPPLHPTLPSSPGLWGLRFMPGRVLDIPPPRASDPPSLPEGGSAPHRPATAEAISAMRPIAADLAPSAVAEPNPAASTTAAAPVLGSTVVAAAPAGSAAELVRPVLPIFLAGLNATSANAGGGAAAPTVQTPATQITLEHMLVAIDRSSWWHNDWLVDPGWYIPGEPRGSSIGLSPAPDQVWGLPIALILVQNLTMTGSWSSADAAQLTSDGTMLGPFNLGGATAATNADSSVSITVPGPSLVALFCQPLVVLPPADPPPSAPPAPNSTPASASGASASPPPTGSGGSAATPPAETGTGSSPPPPPETGP